MTSHRSTTSDTNFRFWHLQFTDYPLGQKIETMQFLPEKNKKAKEYLKGEKLIDKKFYMKKPKKFLNYYSKKYELERCKPFIST